LLSKQAVPEAHNVPTPMQVDLKPIDLERGVRITCDVGFLCPILVFLGLSS